VRRVLLVNVVSLLVLAACRRPVEHRAGGDVRADLARVKAAPDDTPAAATSVNRLGVDLLARELGLEAGNVALSPWSIATALGMVRAGAAGTTAQEIDRVLHAPDGAALHQGLKGLAQEMAARNGTFPAGVEGELEVELEMADRAFAQQGLHLEQGFLDELAGSYAAGIGAVDYRSDPEAARQAINAWVGEQTQTRIPELLAPGVLHHLTRLVLVNAVYLKADWAVPFSREATAPSTFHAPRGETIVPFMRGSSPRRFATGEGWKAVELPYAGGKLAMTVVLPDEGRYGPVATGLDPGLLDTVAVAPTSEVDLTLPKFDIGRATSLRLLLPDLGMPTAFGDQADFRTMTTSEHLFLDDVIHQANVTVDEKGTVAAAATAAVMRTTSAPARVERLVVDRPFLFFVRDIPTGALLFAGQVTNPAANAS
jgi:serine protease inhibitor